MEITDHTTTLCCGKNPILDTWDENEMRSIKCAVCGKQTKSYFMRCFAYKDWENTTNAKGGNATDK